MGNVISWVYMYIVHKHFLNFQVSNQLTAKYSKEFAEAARANSLDNVNEKVTIRWLWENSKIMYVFLKYNQYMVFKVKIFNMIKLTLHVILFIKEIYYFIGDAQVKHCSSSKEISGTVFIRDSQDLWYTIWARPISGCK